MKEQRLNKRFSAKLPARLKAITPSRTRVLDVETKLQPVASGETGLLDSFHLSFG